MAMTETVRCWVAIGESWDGSRHTEIGLYATEDRARRAARRAEGKYANTWVVDKYVSKRLRATTPKGWDKVEAGDELDVSEARGLARMAGDLDAY